MTIETMLLTYWLASGASQQSPATAEACARDLHAIERWARVIALTGRGHLAIEGDAVIDSACVPVDLTPCEAEGS